MKVSMTKEMQLILERFISMKPSSDDVLFLDDVVTEFSLNVQLGRDESEAIERCINWLKIAQYVPIEFFIDPSSMNQVVKSGL